MNQPDQQQRIEAILVRYWNEKVRAELWLDRGRVNVGEAEAIENNATDEATAAITALIDEAEKRGVEALATTITNNTGVSEMYGWPEQLEKLKEWTYNRLQAQLTKQSKGEVTE